MSEIQPIPHPAGRYQGNLDTPGATANDTPTGLAAEVGRQTADLAAILFNLPIHARLRSMFEAEIRDEVAALFGADPGFDPAECENCQSIAWVAFDRRLAVHARNQHRGGQA